MISSAFDVNETQIFEFAWLQNTLIVFSIRIRFWLQNILFNAVDKNDHIYARNIKIHM